MSEPVPPKFRLGEAVASRKVGLPVAGTVVGILAPGALLVTVTAHALWHHGADFGRATFPGVDYDRWDHLYPGWEARPVFQVLRPLGLGDDPGPPGDTGGRGVLYFYPEGDLEPFDPG